MALRGIVQGNQGFQGPVPKVVAPIVQAELAKLSQQRAALAEKLDVAFKGPDGKHEAQVIYAAVKDKIDTIFAALDKKEITDKDALARQFAELTTPELLKNLIVEYIATHPNEFTDILAIFKKEGVLDCDAFFKKISSRKNDLITAMIRFYQAMAQECVALNAILAIEDQQHERLVEFYQSLQDEYEPQRKGILAGFRRETSALDGRVNQIEADANAQDFAQRFVTSQAKLNKDIESQFDVSASSFITKHRYEQRFDEISGKELDERIQQYLAEKENVKKQIREGQLSGGVLQTKENELDATRQELKKAIEEWHARHKNKKAIQALRENIPSADSVGRDGFDIDVPVCFDSSQLAQCDLLRAIQATRSAVHAQAQKLLEKMRYSGGDGSKAIGDIKDAVTQAYHVHHSDDGHDELVSKLSGAIEAYLSSSQSRSTCALDFTAKCREQDAPSGGIGFIGKTFGFGGVSQLWTDVATNLVQQKVANVSNAFATENAPKHARTMMPATGVVSEEFSSYLKQDHVKREIEGCERRLQELNTRLSECENKAKNGIHLAEKEYIKQKITTRLDDLRGRIATYSHSKRHAELSTMLAGKPTFFQRHPVLKGVLIGAAVGLLVVGGIAAAATAIVFTGGAGAPIITGIFAAVKTAFSFWGAVGVFAAAGAGIMGFFASVGGLIAAKLSGKSRAPAKQPKQADDLNSDDEPTPTPVTKADVLPKVAHKPEASPDKQNQEVLVKLAKEFLKQPDCVKPGAQKLYQPVNIREAISVIRCNSGMWDRSFVKDFFEQEKLNREGLDSLLGDVAKAAFNMPPPGSAPRPK